MAFGSGERDVAGGEVLVEQRKVGVVGAVEDADAVTGNPAGEVFADQPDDGADLVVGVGGVDDLGGCDVGVRVDGLAAALEFTEKGLLGGRVSGRVIDDQRPELVESFGGGRIRLV